jgi:uncharacterized protein (TIGR01777 family)
MSDANGLPTIALSGCTGQVGSRLIEALSGQANLVVYTRRPVAARERLKNPSRCTFVEADVTQAGPWQNELAKADAVVNLFGEGIFNRRWTQSFKELLLSSRIDSTSRIADALKSREKPAVWINASAIGFYGASGPEVSDENAPAGTDLLAQLSVEWEEAMNRHPLPAVRKVALRIGIVLDPRAGALPKMAFPFRLFLGGKIGWGRYAQSWIHHADLTGLILHALDQETVNGPLNATAPNPVTNGELAQALGKALHRPALFPVPAWVLRIVLGEVATAICQGRRVLPAKALATGYRFLFPTIDQALSDLFVPSRSR